MAGRGPAPKDRSKRIRPGKDHVPQTVVSDDDVIRGPALPAGMDWPDETQRWWSTWRTSPQAQSWTATDWDFLLDTALLHAQLWTGHMSVAAELRLRVAKFGATPEDRARLRLQIDNPEQPGEEAKPPEQGRYAHLRAVKAA